ncbi:MAG TPA: sugar phosphate nucleotidyltransferase, partial [Candidatus Synoicihabitans sp.]|nr:sugar phosphate nucleotidyltransferase [Candidatus Synoicihabitans sp.]
MAPILLILAAGLGSRYCGLKQLDPVGPGGETLLDYAVHDAIGSGFGRLVFVIRRDFEAAFRSEIVSRYERRVPVDLVYQEVDDVPRAAPTLLARTKPWGTGHAVWAARAALSAPFAVINADDFYGRSAFRQLAHWLRSEAAPERAALVGYRLERTLSPHGPVSRGVCSVDTRGQLTTVVEHTGIFRGNDGIIRGQCERSHRALSGDE